MALHGRSQIFANDLDAFTKCGAKDPYTQGHSERVAFVGKLIAKCIPELNTETVYSCGLIHDVGKLSIPDRILFKKSRLTEEEYQIMKTILPLALNSFLEYSIIMKDGTGKDTRSD